MTTTEDRIKENSSEYLKGFAACLDQVADDMTDLAAGFRRSSVTARWFADEITKENAS